jgi:hypothetical protein
MRRWFLICLTLFALGCGKKNAEPWEEEPAPDAGPLAISVVDPSDGAAGVSRNTHVLLLFNQPIETTSVQNGTNLRLARVLTEEPLSEEPLSTELTLHRVEGGHSALLVPFSPLEPESLYSISLDTTILSAGGNALEAPFRSSFTTGF